MNLTYTTIQHNFRKENNLSCNEYVLLDMIYLLHTSPISKIQGWCYMKRETMADEIGISKQGLLNIIDRLIDSEFLIRDDETRYLKTTNKWNKVYFTGSKQSVPEVNEVFFLSKESVLTSPENFPTDNNTKLNNNINNNIMPENRIQANKKKINIPFEEFWNLYDRKEDKKNCFKKWNSLSDNDRRLIMEDIPKYFSTLSNPIYKKYPYKYLNGEMWLDERNSIQNKNPTIKTKIHV